MWAWLTVGCTMTRERSFSPLQRQHCLHDRAFQHRDLKLVNVKIRVNTSTVLSPTYGYNVTTFKWRTSCPLTSLKLFSGVSRLPSPLSVCACEISTITFGSPFSYGNWGIKRCFRARTLCGGTKDGKLLKEI